MLFTKIYVLSWQEVFLLMPFMTLLGCVFVWSCKRVFARPEHIYFLLLLVWTIVVAYETVWRRTVRESAISLVPFDSYLRALEQPELYRTNFMNVLLFFPGGILLTLAMHTFEEKWKRFGRLFLRWCVSASL